MGGMRVGLFGVRSIELPPLFVTGSGLAREGDLLVPQVSHGVAHFVAAT
jgi:hypothetical protein